MTPENKRVTAHGLGGRAGRRRWSVGAAAALVYLLFPAIDLVRADEFSWWIRALALLTLICFGAMYVFVVPFFIINPDPRRVLIPVAMFGLTWLLFPIFGADIATLWIFVSVCVAAMFSKWQTLVVAFLLAAGLLLLQHAYREEPAWYLAVTLVAVSLWMSSFIDNVKVSRDLQNAREELANLAVANERQRISRDLHDILGHSLTAIAVKSGLARRLLDHDPTAAVAQIADVERLAREALTDVRATASGMRDVSLAAELAIAGSVLRAAGVTASIPTAVDDIDPSGREVFGYVVREAVTNVVRHSRATRCTVTVTPTSIEIADNGWGSVSSVGPEAAGSGLTGLTERLAKAGGRLSAGPAAGGGFVVRAEMASK